MTRQKAIGIPLAAILIAFINSGPDSSAQEEGPALPPIRQVDHIMIRTQDPSNLFTFFTEILRLPVAWPLATRGDVTSGGVGFGNVNVEAIQFPMPGGKPLHTRLLGFALEPFSLGESLVELDRRGITFGDPRPFVATGQDGSKETLWTNVTLAQFSDADRPVGAAIHIFLSEYSPAYVNVEQRRDRLRKALAERSGGPLGVEAVTEVTIGTTNLKVATELWGRLLEPIPTSAPGQWQVGDGPAIHLVQAEDNAMQGFVIGVASLQRAKVSLQERGLLGAVSERELTIEPSKIEGLNIRLVEIR